MYIRVIITNSESMGKRSIAALKRRKAFRRRQGKFKKFKLRETGKDIPIDVRDVDKSLFSTCRRKSQPCTWMPPLDLDYSKDGPCSSHDHSNNVVPFEEQLRSNAIEYSTNVTPGSSPTVQDLPDGLDTDIDAWSASSPPKSASEGDLTSEHDSESSTSLALHVAQATEVELPMIVVDEHRGLEVHLSADMERHAGARILKLSTEEYFIRMLEKEKKTKIALKCLRNKVETLKKKLITKEHSLMKEKEEAISSIRSFWRDHLIEGSSRGGKKVKAALSKK